MSKMKFIILFVLILNSSWASQEICFPSITKEEFAEVVLKTRITHMPSLTHATIDIKEFNSKSYYLQAKPVVNSLINKKIKKKYIIEVNPKIYDCPPSMDALEAILTHEFEHIVDYENMSLLEIAKFGARYASSEKYRASYERKTDEKVLIKNLGLGLISYREWIYSKLSAKDLLIKKRFYYTPEEIDQWTLNQNSRF